MKKIQVTLHTIFCICLFFLCVVITAFASSKSKTNFSTRDIQLLAKQMDSPTLSEKQKKDTSEKLRLLSRDEVLTLKKLWRAEFVAKGIVSQKEALGFIAIEKIEIIFSEKITEFFGEDATFFNISSDDLTSVESSLSGDSELMDLTYSVENIFKTETSTSFNAQLLMIASTCYYDNNWPHVKNISQASSLTKKLY